MKLPPELMLNVTFDNFRYRQKHLKFTGTHSSTRTGVFYRLYVGGDIQNDLLLQYNSKVKEILKCQTLSKRGTSQSEKNAIYLIQFKFYNLNTLNISPNMK